jgi:hypothetical protein
LQKERFLAKERAVAAGLADIDRARPIPDPQDRGLIKGAGTAGAAAKEAGGGSSSAPAAGS